MGTGAEMVRQWVSELFDKNDKENTYKVLLVGDCVGKSSLLLRFFNDSFIEESAMQFIPMTIGLDVKTKIVDIDLPDRKEQVTLNIWDTAGQDRFRKMNEQYLPTADAVILLYDVKNLQTFKECRTFVDDVARICDTEVVKVLVGNKNDTDQSKKVVTSDQGREFAALVGFEFTETSAKDNLNVQQLFHMVARMCFHRRQSSDSDVSPS